MSTDSESAPPGGIPANRRGRKPVNPLSAERHKDAHLLSRLLGRAVILGEITPDSLQSVLKPALREAYLADPESVIVACAGRVLKAGLMRLQDHGVYLHHEQLLELLVSLCWNPNKGAAGKSGIEAYDPMKCRITTYVSKCVNEAISVLIHETQQLVRTAGRSRRRISLPTVSLDEMEEGGLANFTDNSEDFRDGLDSPEDIERQALLEAKAVIRRPVVAVASPKAQAVPDHDADPESDPEPTFTPSNLPPHSPAEDQAQPVSEPNPSEAASKEAPSSVDGVPVSNDDPIKDLRARYGAVQQQRPAVSPGLLQWMHDLDWVLRPAREPTPQVSHWQKLGSTLMIELPLVFAPASLDEVREAVRKQCAVARALPQRPTNAREEGGPSQSKSGPAP